MKTGRFLIVVAIVVLAASVVAGQSVIFTGQLYNGWPESSRLVFAVGYISGFAAGTLHPADALPSIVPAGAAVNKQLISCLIEKWTYGQAQAIIDQYVREHPAEWHEHIALIAYSAFRAACKV